MDRDKMYLPLGTYTYDYEAVRIAGHPLIQTFAITTESIIDTLLVQVADLGLCYSFKNQQSIKLENLPYCGLLPILHSYLAWLVRKALIQQVVVAWECVAGP